MDIKKLKLILILLILVIALAVAGLFFCIYRASQSEYQGTLDEGETEYIDETPDPDDLTESGIVIDEEDEGEPEIEIVSDEESGEPENAD